MSLSYACEQPGGEHYFAEADITEDDEPPGVLREGMKIIMPCRDCGMTPLEQMNSLGEKLDEAEQALSKRIADESRPLFHWAPIARRKQIVRYGLRPHMRPNTCTGESFKLAEICFSDDPLWAWDLSGGQRHAVRGVWDLWQTWSHLIGTLVVLGSFDRDDGTHEIRTADRVYKRYLRLVGQRVND